MSEPEAIGHVVLNVSDVERSVRFYRDLVGFQVSYQPGSNMAFLTCGKVHHDLALFKAPAGARPYEQGQVGLHHFAFQLKNYEALQAAYRRLIEAGAEVTGTVDFGFMRTVSVADPDGIRLELFANTYATDEEGAGRDQFPKSSRRSAPHVRHLGARATRARDPCCAWTAGWQRAANQIVRLPSRSRAFNIISPLILAYAGAAPHMGGWVGNL